MFNAAFKKTLLSTLATATVASLMAASPSLAGEGGNTDLFVLTITDGPAPQEPNRDVIVPIDLPPEPTRWDTNNVIIIDEPMPGNHPGIFGFDR